MGWSVTSLGGYYAHHFREHGREFQYMIDTQRTQGAYCLVTPCRYGRKFGHNQDDFEFLAIENSFGQVSRLRRGYPCKDRVRFYD